jgi:prepilin-type processing-associated H-X9-DG protein
VLTGSASNAWLDNTFQPMPSLACLYPAYVDNSKVFGCPSTADKPLIASMYVAGGRHTCFGYLIDPMNTGTVGGSGYNSTDPAAYSGSEVATDKKCSYLYDELTHFRDIGPGQAMACDADGQTWKTADGKTPGYVNWVRMPRKSNHDNGQNVMYFDGHIKWVETVYASRDPKDNIFCPNGATIADQWGKDTDAYLWDGAKGDSRTLQRD